jgi:hypothetical protein
LFIVFSALFDEVDGQQGGVSDGAAESGAAMVTDALSGV